MGNETPTNDAPVTAEQCDRDFTADILDFIAGLNTFPDAMRHSASCMRQGAKGEAQFRPLTDMLARHRLAALASAPAPSWSETPEHIRDHLALLAEVELHLQSSRVFVTTREKMHPCGVELHDELLGKVTAAIEMIGKGQAHG